MKKLPLVVVLICMPFLLTGCWDSTELNDVSIVTGIAIEKGKKDKFKLIVEIINASEFSIDGGKGNTPTIVYSLEGNSVSELADKMNKGFIRKLIYSHTRVLVIDESVAKEGLLDFMDFLERSGEFRNDFNILISKDVKASEILKVTYPVQGSAAMKLNEQIETFLNEWGGDPNVRLTDFISALISKGRSPVLAAVTIQGKPEKGHSVENNQNVTPEAITVMDGLAVFDNDTLVGFLPVEGTRNYRWTQDLNTTTVTVPCGSGDDERYIDVRVNYSSTSNSVTYEGNKPKINLDIKVEGIVQGTQCPDDLGKISTYRKFDEYVEKFIEKEITSTIETVQKEYKVDIFGFGEDLERQNFQKFQEVKDAWNEEFANAEVEVHANVLLRRSGIRTKSFLTDYLKKENE